MGSIEFRDRVVGVQGIPWLPLVVLRAITFPLDQVLGAMVTDARVEYFLDFELEFAINDHRVRRRGLFASREGFARCWEQLDDRKDGMKASH